MTGCIYKITNKANGKRYVGKTTQNPIARFGRHITSAYEAPTNDLHREMVEQGYQNFRIDVLEEGIPVKELPSREQFHIGELTPEYNKIVVVNGVSQEQEKMILELNKKGYSIHEISQRTKVGGINTMRTLHRNGIRKRNVIDPERVIELYLGGLSTNQVATQLKISASAAVRILKKHNIKTRGVSVPIKMLTLSGEIIRGFPSCRQGAMFIAPEREHRNIEQCSKNINSCCGGHRKSAYGYRWEYAGNESRGEE